MPTTRKRLFARGVSIGYIALVAQIFYSLASIPLALSHLSQAEFGMFSLILSLVSYLGLAELGMTDGFNRHLFECKDGSDPARYGRYFTAGLMALGVVSLAILVLGVAGTFLTASFYNISENLRAEFLWVMLGMVVLTAVSMATRMLGTPLLIHQRHDLIQLSQLCQYGIFYFVLRYGLKAGWGVYALLANQIAAYLWGMAFSVISCLRLGLYPKRGCWALPHRDEWRSVLGYSRDIFTFQLGSKLSGGMALLLLPRLLGLEAVAAWTVCSRPFSILRQFVAKPYDYTVPLLCEMYVRDETQRVAKRWCQITQLITTLSVCVFAIAAANNALFIHLWTGQHMSWDPLNHWLLAFKFLAVIIGTAAMGSIGLQKRIGGIKFVPYLEVILLIVNGLWMTHLWGISGLLLAGALSPLLGSAYFGIRHLAAITHQSTRSLVLASLGRPLLLLPLACGIAWSVAYLYQNLPGYPRLLLSAGTSSILLAACGYMIGFSSDVRKEIVQMLSKSLERFGIFSKLKDGC